MRKTILATTAITALIAAGAVAQTTTDPAPAETAPIVESEAAGTGAVVPVDDAATETATAREGWDLEEGWQRVDPATISAENLIGSEIQTITDDKVAEVKDVMMSADGKVETIAASFGGFFGFGENTVLLTLDEIDIVKDGSDAMIVRTNLTPEALKDLPEYEG